MAESVLNTTKNSLGLAEDYEVFDGMIIMHINSTFSILKQLGLPSPGPQYFITNDSETWEDFFTACGPVVDIMSVKTYMYLKVRSLFDPLTTSFGISAMEKQIQELEWRLNVSREDEQWQDPSETTL